jgi:hypothetical protein
VPLEIFFLAIAVGVLYTHELARELELNFSTNGDAG